MLKGSNKERLEQEIAQLVNFICIGRKFFFEKTGNSMESGEEFVNYFSMVDLFQNDKDLQQLDLNIQLFYIKLVSYYDSLDKNQPRGLKLPRNVFSHYRTSLVFSKNIDYNFFLYKATKNFRKIQYLFYSETLEVASNETVKPITLNLDKDINDFLLLWSGTAKK